ncbi:MAG: hypothetical protein QOF48_1255 [Verrucomicrobiota bacterium]|jgi:uncharacterized membrane protein YcjF (UPF0283 family)
MRLTLVGNRRGRRVIVWGGVLKLAAVVVPVPGLIAVLVKLIVTKFWNTEALLLGLAAGGVVVILVVIGAFCTELRKLPILHEDKRPSP